MPATPKCFCEKCASCRSRASMRRKRAKWNSPERMPWPAEYFSLYPRNDYSQYRGETYGFTRNSGHIPKD